MPLTIAHNTLKQQLLSCSSSQLFAIKIELFLIFVKTFCQHLISPVLPILQEYTILNSIFILYICTKDEIKTNFKTYVCNRGKNMQISHFYINSRFYVTVMSYIVYY